MGPAPQPQNQRQSPITPIEGLEEAAGYSSRSAAWMHVMVTRVTRADFSPGWRQAAISLLQERGRQR